MKKNVFFFLLTIVSLSSFAQDPLTKGDIKLNAGLGLVSFIRAAGGKTTVPPITGSLEYAVNENVTVGPVVGYTAVDNTYTDVDVDYNTGRLIYTKATYRTSHLLIGARGSYYFSVDPKFDVYAGVLLSYDVISTKAVSPTASSPFSDDLLYDYPSILYSFHAGGRYKFSPNLAAFAQIGYGLAALNIGLTFSLKK